MEEIYYEIYYYGEIFEDSNGQRLITSALEAPAKVVGINPLTKEETIFYDGAYEGYNNLFCDEFDKDIVLKRTLTKLDIPLVKVVIEKGEGIDYEEEKEDFDVDDEDFVTLINGEKMHWDDVKKNGFDYITITGTTQSGEEIEIFSEELA